MSKTTETESELIEELHGTQEAIEEIEEKQELTKADIEMIRTLNGRVEKILSILETVGESGEKSLIHETADIIDNPASTVAEIIEPTTERESTKWI